MATTGELRAIIEELELIDIGDAASYLGEEAVESVLPVTEQTLAIVAKTPEHLSLDEYTSRQG